MEEPLIVPHVLNSPLKHGTRQCDVVRIPIPKGKECDNALRDAVTVDRIGSVVEIAGRAIAAEEVSLVERQTASNARLELIAR